MKRLLNVLIFIFLFGAIIAIGYTIKRHLQKGEHRTVSSIIPADVLFQFRTQNITSLWHETSFAPVWKQLCKFEHWHTLDISYKTVSKNLNHLGLNDLLFTNRDLSVSAHMISGQDYGFLLIADLVTEPTIKVVKKHLIFNSLLVTHRNFKGYQIEEVHEFNANNSLYFSFVDNLLVLSSSPQIIERAIAQSKVPDWQVEKKVNTSEFSKVVVGGLSVFFNYKRLEQLSGAFLKEKEVLIQSISKCLNKGEYQVTLHNNRIEFGGITFLDSIPTYFSELSKLSSSEMTVDKVLSNQVALLGSFCISNFQTFRKLCLTEQNQEKKSNLKDLFKKQQTMEKFLGINLQQNFYSWIGKEIAFIKLRPSSKTRVEDILLAIEMTDTKAAEKGLKHILSAMQKHAPMVSSTSSYRGIKVNHFQANGFFHMFLSDLFPKLNTVYFAMIENFVFFSNSEHALADNIDHYLAGLTLNNEATFRKFKQQWKDNAVFNFYVQNSKLYPNLYHHCSNTTRELLKTTKVNFLTFDQLVYRLKSNKSNFITEGILQYNEQAASLDQLQESEYYQLKSAYHKSIERLEFHIPLPIGEFFQNGTYTVSSETKKNQFQGTIWENKIQGAATYYYASGRPFITLNYRNSLPHGNSKFYYDTPNNSLKAEVEFNNGKIVNNYKGYHKNGKLQSKIFYSNGKATNNAEFYYENGTIFEKGAFKKGRKQGVWKQFSRQGIMDKKIVWENGYRKKIIQL